MSNNNRYQIRQIVRTALQRWETADKLRTGSAALIAASLTVAAPVGLAQATVADSLDEVVITGSRVERAGFEAPTPLTVMGIEELKAAPVSNLAEFVNTLPSVVGSATPQTSNTSISAGTAGVNALNLRGLGTVRTLVLVDGQRSVGSILNGTVDVNNIPQSLVKRVEVVTGGASAAYGSDAVSGVVNFILDRDYTGFKGEFDANESGEGDNKSVRGSLTFGTPFAGDRGHFIAAADYTDDRGVKGVPRDWNQNGWYMINNPAYTATNGQPEYLVTPNAALMQASAGGLITNTVLRGTAFGPGGVPYQFNYGSFRPSASAATPQTAGPWMVGGGWEDNQFNSAQSLKASEERKGGFGRLSFDFTENVTGFVQASYNNTKTNNTTGYQFNQANVVIRSDNAFIPASVRSVLQANNLAQFTMGTMNADLPLRLAVNDRTVTRFVAGLDGRVNLFDSSWKWNAYYQRGESDSLEMAQDITNNARLALAQDAVFRPGTSEVVCRSTLTDPNNGCVPLNRMGIGVASPAALRYVLGNPQREQTLKQSVAAVSINGEPFSVPAGPVSLATGIEWREEEVTGFVDPLYRSGWFVGNYLPNFGKYDVKEAFLETVVPLASGSALAEALDLNAAVRRTDYSTSGAVTTWKVGITYSPIDDLRFRMTRSRDIRAPNLGELFAAGTSNTNNVLDPFNNNANTQYRGVNRGNPNLKPEEADQWGLGVVLQPSALPGFNASVDYYEIDLTGAIGSLPAQEIVDRCFEGNQVYCVAITRGVAAGGTNIITEIAISPFNLAQRLNRGLDVELSYTRDVAGIGGNSGNLQLRALMTKYYENFVNDGIVRPTDSVGRNTGDGPPNHIYRLSARYRTGPYSMTLIGRGVSSGVYNTAWVECTSGCPASNSFSRTINNNKIDGQFVMDANLTYAVERDDAMSYEVFFNIRNLLDKDPPIVAPGPAGSAYGTPATNPTLFDQLGRNFRLGVRFKM